jgi:hypothetical protein
MARARIRVDPYETLPLVRSTSNLTPQCGQLSPAVSCSLTSRWQLSQTLTIRGTPKWSAGGVNVGDGMEGGPGGRAKLLGPVKVGPLLVGLLVNDGGREVERLEGEGLVGGLAGLGRPTLGVLLYIAPPGWGERVGLDGVRGLPPATGVLPGMAPGIMPGGGKPGDDVGGAVGTLPSGLGDWNGGGLSGDELKGGTPFGGWGTPPAILP